MKQILSIELAGLVITFLGWLTGIKPIQLIGALIVIAVTGFIIYELDQKDRRKQGRRTHDAKDTWRDSDDRVKLY